MQKKSSTTRDVLRIFWEHAKKYPIVLGMVLVTPILGTVVDIVVPIFYKKFFDAFGTSGADQTLVKILFIILGLQGVAWLIWRVSHYGNIHFQTWVMADLRKTSFASLIKHSYTFFANHFGGSLVQRHNRLPRSFETVADRLCFDFIPLFVRILGTMIVLLSINKLVALIMAAWIIIFAGVNVWFAIWRLPFNILRAAKESESTGVLSDAVTNHTNIQMFAGYDYEKERFGKVVNEHRLITRKTWNQQWVADGIQAFFVVLIQFAVFYVMVRYRSQHSLFTIGAFVLVQTYIFQLVDKLWNLGRVIRQLYESFGDAKEMVDILQTPYDIKDVRGAAELNVKKGKIEFSKVSFHFHKTRQVLDNLSLLIRPSERVALVGHSGAGKSTLIKLLFRLYDTDEGKILIDGQDIKKVSQESLRNAIGMVPQDPILFHRTLMDNIRYGRRDATDEEVMEAAKKAHCHEFIAALPEGYHTFVGERGIKLSGGERQRVAIARAFLKNAPILVLDEATSSLDSEVELLIQESLRELMRDKTVLVIAHRLSTIRQMDRIIVLAGGKVVDQGTHEDLLESQGLYASLWRLQSGGFITMKETE